MGSILIWVVLVIIISFFVWLSEASTEEGRERLLAEADYRKNYDYYQALEAERIQREVEVVLDRTELQAMIAQTPTPTVIRKQLSDRAKMNRVLTNHTRESCEAEFRSMSEEDQNKMQEFALGIMKLQQRGELPKNLDDVQAWLLAKEWLDNSRRV